MTLKGGPELQARLRAIGDTSLMLKRVQIRGVREAKLIVPRRTGNLGRTIRVGAVSDSKCAIVAGGRLRVGYAVAVERGTRPRTIVPKNARALAWGGNRRLSGSLRTGSKPDHFAMRVRHPGSKPKPYLVPGLIKAARDEGLPAIVEAWNSAA